MQSNQTINDFLPTTQWERREYRTRLNAIKYRYYDPTTKKCYDDDSITTLRVKFFLLNTPLLLFVNIATNIIPFALTAVSLLILPTLFNDATFKDLCHGYIEVIIELIKIPLLLIAIQCISLFGFFDPLNGRKLYNSIRQLAEASEGDAITSGFIAAGDCMENCEFKSWRHIRSHQNIYFRPFTTVKPIFPPPPKDSADAVPLPPKRLW